MYDLIIVGAGPAGSALARRIGRDRTERCRTEQGAEAAQEIAARYVGVRVHGIPL